MAKTISDLRTQVRSYLDEAQQTDFLNTEVDSSINNSYHELVTTVIGIFEDYYITQSQTDTVANIQEYTLPLDFYKIKRVEVNFTPSNPNSNPARLVAINLEDVRTRLASPGSSIYGGAYYIIGNDIGIVPTPTTGGTNALTVWYIQTQSDLSDANPNVNIPYADRFASLIPLAAAADLLRKGQQAEREAAQYNKEYEAGLMKMKQELIERQDDNVKVVTDTVGEDIDFGSWI